MSFNLPDSFFFNSEPPNKGKKVFTWLWLISVIFFLWLPHLGFDCLFGWCVLHEPMWIFLAFLLGTGVAILALGILNIWTKTDLTDWELDETEAGQSEMKTDPVALAEQLVREAPASRAGNFDHLELEATRWLMEERQGDDFDRAMDIVRQRLAELLGIPLPQDSPKPDSPAVTPEQPPRDLKAEAEMIVAGAFAAPFDGTPERLEVLSLRARNLCGDLLKDGLSRKTLDALVSKEAAALRDEF